MRFIALHSERPVHRALVGSLKQARAALVRAVIVLILSHGASLARAQSAPVSPDHLWHGIGEKSIEAEAKSAAVWSVARSELYPKLAAAALSGVNRAEDYTATRFYRRTIADFQAALGLNYTVVDFVKRLTEPSPLNSIGARNR